MSLSANQNKQSDDSPQISLGGVIPRVPDIVTRESEGDSRGDADQPAETRQDTRDRATVQSPHNEGSRGKKWQGIALDSLLVALVVGVLGGGGY